MKTTKQLFAYLVYGDYDIDPKIGIDTNKTFQLTYTMFEDLFNEYKRNFRLLVSEMIEKRGLKNDFDAGYEEALNEIKEVVDGSHSA